MLVATLRRRNKLSPYGHRNRLVNLQGMNVTIRRAVTSDISGIRRLIDTY